MEIDFTPTEGMATAAKRALKWHEEGKPGGTQVGLARANQLAKRETLTERTVLRMYSFFSRHEPDKAATGFNSGEEGYPSKGRVAWDMWGGDAGYTWSTKKRNQIMDAREAKAMDMVTDMESNATDLQMACLTALASEFSLYLKAHGYHWNVESRDFQEYHALFAMVYEDIYDNVDSFAEKCRALQVKVPASLGAMKSLAVIEDELGYPGKDEMVANLLSDSMQVYQALRDAYNLCELNGEHGFSNFLAERLDAHRKYQWQLRASQVL